MKSYEVTKNKGKNCNVGLLGKRKAKKNKSRAERSVGKVAIATFIKTGDCDVTFKTPRKGWVD